jgi:DNA-binding NtrC family response regulator
MQTAIPTRSTVSNAIQNISSLLLHVGRPNLLAVDLVSILIDAHVVTSARATSRSPEGSTEILASYLCSDSLDGPKQVIEIGTTTGRCVQVTLQPLPDAESRATVSALALILSAVRDLERAKMEREERLALWPLEEELDDDGNGVIIGHMRELMLFAKKIAKTSINVLLTGESGTGKEILARAIHKYSARADKPFMPFNCTAVPRDMLESQLFGHRRGAFTSADRDNPGLIRAAKGGTLFLDEIGELSLDLQPKLLRFLESGEISPLGEAGPLNVDVRVIAATNRDLEELVREGRFREDLFYRLNVIRLSILPLRERRDEVPALIHHFVSRSAQDLGKGQLRVAEETMERFLLYPWPGNVRQMQNEIRRIVALADVDGVLTADMLSADIRKTGPRASATRKDGLEMNVPLTDKLSPTLAHVEREMIRLALKKTHGRLDAAARSLGISRKGLYLKRQRLGL